MRINKGSSRKNEPIIIISVNWEDLLHKSEEEIVTLSDRLNRNLRLARTKKDEKSAKTLEKEICYIQREMKYRENRENSHEKNPK
jgi:hypothetical protein